MIGRFLARLLTPRKPAPLVSVIIPTWNWSRALRCAITTVLRQSYTNFELLVVGDCCTDDSAAVVASFSDSRVRWHNLPKNIGSQSGPNNAGLAMARGEYIAYLGHDDLWLADHLESLVRAATEAEADVAVAGILMLGPIGSELRVISGFLPREAPASEPMEVPPSAILHRRDVAEAIGGWRSPAECEVAPDMDFLKRCWEYRWRVTGNRRITVIKFNACWRPNSYLTLDASDQEKWLARIVHEPDFLERELHETLACVAPGRLISLSFIRARDGVPKGWNGVHLRRIRGLGKQPVGSEQVANGIRFTADHAGLVSGWWFPEDAPEIGPWRWSGPGTVSIGEFSEIPETTRFLRLRLLEALLPEQLSIEVRINGEPVRLTRADSISDATFTGEMPEATGTSRSAHLEMLVPTTVRPCDVDPENTDSRQLGVRFSWVEFLSSLEVAPAD